jgi:hypothetical protein
MMNRRAPTEKMKDLFLYYNFFERDREELKNDYFLEDECVSGCVIDESLFHFLKRMSIYFSASSNVLWCCYLHGDGDDDDDDNDHWVSSLILVFRLHVLQTGSSASFDIYVYLYLALCVHSACGLVCPRFGSLAKFVENM